MQQREVRWTNEQPLAILCKSPLNCLLGLHLPFSMNNMKRGLLATLVPSAGVTRCDYVSEGLFVFPAPEGEKKKRGGFRKVTTGRHHVAMQRHFV